MVPVFPLLLATYLPGMIRTVARNPTLVAVKLWATAHLLAEYGGAGGSNPVVLVDDQGEVYYGPAQITATSWGGQYVEIDVRLTEIPYRKLYV